MYKRIIPLFLLKGNRLVKGVNFSNYIDVGDPVSQAMIYDAQGADELIIVDITASKEGRLINTKIVKKIAEVCRLPLAVGGGIKSVTDAKKVLMSGADKIVLNTWAVKHPELVSELSKEFGSQSIVVSIDVKQNALGDYEIYIFSGDIKTEINLLSFLEKIQQMGAGELLITSIDKEGTLSGFDIELYKRFSKIINVPFIASGGAGTYDNIVELFEKTKTDACAIGKMLFLRDYDIVRIKQYIKGKGVAIREA